MNIAAISLLITLLVFYLVIPIVKTINKKIKLEKPDEYHSVWYDSESDIIILRSIYVDTSGIYRTEYEGDYEGPPYFMERQDELVYLGEF